ncbi:hypothetical protein Patl1_08743 [Pistacia atlantica]|uniref:Uncharacterized protein n=1 Tax=Pistacia atlantica TaxID=434234 RepID=A0ACC1AGK0_9ROSI|nr:hypothetical protein Patl1_08743 [Pistacia atlantica]
MALYSIFFLFVLLTVLPHPSQSITANQSQFFVLMKASLSGDALSGWDIDGGKPYCNFSGISCNNQGYVDKIDISRWSLSGQFPSGVCSYMPQLRILRLDHNHLYGNFFDSFVNCSFLEELKMSFVYLKGTLPDFSPLKSLRILDLSYNLFSGDFPISVTNLSNLEVLNFNENPGFNSWQLPENISRLTKLRSMILATCVLHGRIPPSIGNMTSLTDLELSGNFLTNQIPPEIGLLKNLQQLELYYNQHLSGTIPEELGNLTELTDLDMSVNRLTGKIPESICRLPKLRVLQLYNNSLTGEIPSAIENSTTLTILSLYDNFLTGEVPQNLGRFSSMVVLDVSENKLSGPLPTEVCNGGKLKYFLVLSNFFSGELPTSLEKCTTLLRFRVSNNRLEGTIPQGIFGLPHASIIDLGYNGFSGPIANTIRNARNLSELFMPNNKISGVLPPEISGGINLVKIDLSNNFLSGPIPSGIGNLKKLNLLILQNNKLNSSIPKSLSSLKSLNVLDLSNNLLTGKIPQSLCDLLPNSINFSNNRLSGPIPPSLIKGGLVESFSGNPGLCVSVNVKSSDQDFPLCPKTYNRRRRNTVWAVVISAFLIFIGLILFVKRRLSKQSALMEHDETFSSAFFSYDVKSFHLISFDQREIFEAMTEKNKVGQGGYGTVYKIELKSGETIAVKKLWSQRTKDSVSQDQLLVDKVMKTEVDTLGNIRHKNIVKLYCYFSKYAYSSKATTKCDVYSFGIVLMELITGRKPVEADFGENKNIIYWVSTKIDSKDRVMEVFDKRLLGSFGDEMIRVLRIAIRCTNKAPAVRPTMNEVVQLLAEADPCQIRHLQVSDQTKESFNVCKIKNPSEF